MGNDSNVKGRELEEAVYFIQESILRADPKLRGAEFLIEHNKTITVVGVSHEIDVIARINPGTDFESCMIFECKNWREPVGKNEVIVLSEKIRASAASRGFLVAASFTAGADAQAKQDARVKLIKCSSDWESPSELFGLYHTETELLNIEVTARVIEPGKILQDVKLDIKEIWMLAGQPVALETLVKGYADGIYNDAFTKNRSRLGLEGAHMSFADGRFEFDPGELTCSVRQIEWMQLRCHYRVTNSPVPLISKFALHGYGRTYSFAALPKLGATVRITIGDKTPAPPVA